MSEIKERLRLYCKEKKITEYSFCKKGDIALSFFAKIETDINTNTVSKIKKGYPKIRLDWLILGDGDMEK